MNKIRIFSFGLTLVLSVFLLVGGAFAQVTEITMWFGRQDFIPGDAFETFHAENPDIRVTADVIPLEESLAAYVRTFRAGNPPDIVQVLHFSPSALALQNMVMDITPILEAWEAEDPDSFNDMAPAAWEMASYEGVPHGMALHAAPYWYIWRNDLFDEAGIAEPETWDESLDAGRKLRSDNMLGFSQIGFHGHIDWFISFFVSMGGQFPDNTFQMDSEAGVYLLEFYQTMMRDNIAHPDTVAWDSGESRAAFIAGEAAQIFEGANLFATFQQSLEYGEQWLAKAPLVRPGAEDQWRIGGNSWPYMVSKAAEDKQDAVLKVLQYLARPEIVKEIALRYQPATTMSVFQEPDYLDYQPWFAALFEPYSQQVSIPVRPESPQIDLVVGQAMQEALSNPEADAQAMVTRYQAEIDQIVGR